jgi:hypothetical protein
VIEKLRQQHPKLYKHFFIVTTFSKLLALSLFIILPFIGFYLGMKYQEKITIDTLVFSKTSKNSNLIVPTPTIGLIPTLSPKINNSKELETYTNTQYGFQFKYPTNLGTDCKTEANYCSINKTSTSPGGIDTNFIWFTVVPSNLKDRTYQNSSLYNFQETDELLRMSINDKKIIPSSNSNLSGFTYQRFDNISINGQTAKVFVNNHPWEFPNGTLEKRIVIDYKNYLYTIGSYTGGYISLEIFNQILSTFKFTL